MPTWIHIHYRKISVKFSKFVTVALVTKFKQILWLLSWPFVSESVLKSSFSILLNIFLLWKWKYTKECSNRAPMRLWAISVHCCSTLHKSGFLILKATLVSGSHLIRFKNYFWNQPQPQFRLRNRYGILFFKRCDWTLRGFFCLCACFLQ